MNHSISKPCIGQPISASRRKSRNRIVAIACSTAALTLLGCAAGSSMKPTVGPIAFTDANGKVAAAPLSALTAGFGTYLDVAISNDPQSLGVNWSVSCTNEPPVGTPLPPGQTVDQSCGTFTSLHTTSSPVPSYAANGNGIVTFYTAPTTPPKSGTVTLYASATSDPSSFSSVTVTINGLPITIGFSPSPPSTLEVNGTASIAAVLGNDLSSEGVTWTVTCPSGPCGSFSANHTTSGSATTYTAPADVPAGNTVTITATSVADQTKSISYQVTIVPIAASMERGELFVPAADTQRAHIVT